MHRLQLDEDHNELGTSFSSFRIIGHQRCCARRSYSVRTTSLPYTRSSRRTVK
jgi:hypothetical protein